MKVTIEWTAHLAVLSHVLHCRSAELLGHCMHLALLKVLISRLEDSSRFWIRYRRRQMLHEKSREIFPKEHSSIFWWIRRKTNIQPLRAYIYTDDKHILLLSSQKTSTMIIIICSLLYAVRSEYECWRSFSCRYTRYCIACNWTTETDVHIFNIRLISLLI